MQSRPTPLPHPLKSSRQPWTDIVFLWWDRQTPAVVIRILLVRAGIERNPGPMWTCCVCNKALQRNSVQCSRCTGWVHFRQNRNCSELNNINEYNQQSFVCKTCSTPSAPGPVPLQNVPLPQHLQVQLVNPTVDSNIRVLQFNCNGLKSKLAEIAVFLHDNDIKIAALQETKLSAKSKLPDIPDYTLVRHDRTSDAGGGLAFYVHHSLQFDVLPQPQPDPCLEYLAIKILDTKIVNIYIPPTTSCPGGYNARITDFLPQGEALVLGDLNAHDDLWYSSINDARGSAIADEIGMSNFGVMNEDLPTRMPSNGQETSPDVTLASPALLPTTDWCTTTALGSDHLPIIITLASSTELQWSENKTYVNFKKARWEDFKAETEEAFASLEDPADVYTAEKKFRLIVNKASKYSIPHAESPR